MKMKLTNKGKHRNLKMDKVISSRITDKDIRKRIYEFFPKGEPHEDTSEYDWKKSEEELFSDLGF